MRLAVIVFAGLALAACSPTETELLGDTQPGATVTVAPPAATPPPSAKGLPAGAYKLDATHATLLLRVNHIGFSNYTAQFTKFDAEIDLDPANPSAARLTATVDASSLQLPSPPKGFTEEIQGPQWIDAPQFPKITFVSTAVETTSNNTAKVTGDLTMRGVTKPVTLDMTFNGGYAGNAFDPNARVGFSAHGTFKRSDFGITYGIPEPGTTMGVSDAVEVIIETEFTGLALPPEPAVPSAPN